MAAMPISGAHVYLSELGRKGASDTRDESEAVFGATADHMYTSKRRVGFGGANKRLGGGEETTRRDGGNAMSPFRAAIKLPRQ